jgi:hypothetical protein
MDIAGAAAPIGSTIHLYLCDGRASGIRIVEKDNWSGIGLDCARSDLPTAKRRAVFGRSGVYLLVGDPADPGTLPAVYVGEADELGARIAMHASRSDFWNRLVIFTDKDGNLNKAHAKHLEARLYAIGADVKRSDLRNIVPPGLPNLAERDRDFSERFLHEMLIVLPVIGITAFQLSPPQEASATPPLILERAPVSARGFETSEGFQILAGSTAKTAEVPSIHARTTELRASLLGNGVLEKEGETLLFTQDYVFSSPSEAAAVILARSVNGREKWLTKDGRTLKELQEDAERATVH